MDEEEEDGPYKSFDKLRRDVMRNMPHDDQEDAYHRKYVLATLKTDPIELDQIARAEEDIRLKKPDRNAAVRYLFRNTENIHHFDESRLARRRVIQMGWVTGDELPSPWLGSKLYEESILQGAILHLCIPLSCPQRPKTPWLTKDLVRMVRLALFPRYML
jgi:hypothetical protein